MYWLCRKLLRLLYCSICAFFLMGCQPSPEVYSLQGSTMGTWYHIKLMGVFDAHQLTLLRKGIDLRLQQVDQQMSTYLDTSEVSLFNQAQSRDAIAISEQTATVVAEALRLAELTGGALDITVAPLVNLWGFGPQQRADTIPSQQQLQSIAPYVGYQKLQLTGNTLTKQHPQLSIDLSSIAKGYAVDQISEFLLQQGIADFLVEVGGEMRLHGHKQQQQPWVIAVEDPAEISHSAKQALVIGDLAIATSGDYRNYYEQNGQRFSHTIDPVTEQPITHNLASVSVIHASCMTADGLATALMVMGPEKALAFAQQHQLAVYLITRQGDAFSVTMSDAFKPFLKQD